VVKELRRRRDELGLVHRLLPALIAGERRAGVASLASAARRALKRTRSKKEVWHEDVSREHPLLGRLGRCRRLVRKEWY
jgi:hypothetical protein